MELRNEFGPSKGKKSPVLAELIHLSRDLVLQSSV